MQNIQFYYDFEISKNGLKKCFEDIAKNNSKYGNATVYYIQMGLASLTLLENAFKGINFNFEESTLNCVQQLCEQIKQVKSEKDYLTYCQILGAYVGWCAVKKYKAYFATIDNNFMLICNNKAFNLTAIIQICCEDKNIQNIFNNFNE